MNSKIDYERKSISGCTFNTVIGFDISHANQLNVLFNHDELDYIMNDSFNNKNSFCGIQLFTHYTQELPTKRIIVGKIAADINDEKFVTVKAFIYYKLVKAADELDSDTFVAFHEILLLDAIIAASKKYKIPEENYRELLERRSKLGTIPEWIPDMEENPQLVIDMYKASVPK
jgi:hypothetical protein